MSLSDVYSYSLYLIITLSSLKAKTVIQLVSRFLITQTVP